MAQGDELPSFDIADTETPETLYDRAWAHAVLDATFLDLETMEEAAGRGQIFQVLKSRLNPEGSAEGNQAVVAAEVGMNPESIRQAVSRLRKKFRDCLRKRIAATLNEPDDARIDEELRALKAALME